MSVTDTVLLWNNRFLVTSSESGDVLSGEDPLGEESAAPTCSMSSVTYPSCSGVSIGSS